MSTFQEDNDEHYIALSNLLAQPIDFDMAGSVASPPSGSLSYSGSDSGSSSYRASGSGETSPLSPSAKEQRDHHETLYKTELCRTWEASHSCQYGMCVS